MMKFIILFISSLLLATAASIYIQHDGGYMTMTIAGWTVQMSFALFVITVIILFLILHVLVRVINGVINAPEQLRQWHANKAQRLSEQYLSQGLISLVKGDFISAEKLLIKGAKHSQSPLANYLAAAQIAQKLGVLERRDQYLLKAQEGDQDNHILVDLIQAELQLKNSQPQQALQKLSNLHEQQPGHIDVNKALLHTCVELGHWSTVLELLSTTKGKKYGLTKEQIQHIKLQAYAGLLQQVNNTADNKEMLRKNWNAIPKKLQKDPYLIEVYTEEKLKLSDSADCEPLIRRALKKQPTATLINLYGLVESNNLARQLKFVEGLLTQHGRNDILLLTAGRLSAKNKLFGKAKNYLQESLVINPLPETYQMLGQLMAELGEHETATENYQKGLQLATLSQQHKPEGLLLEEHSDQPTLSDR